MGFKTVQAAKYSKDYWEVKEDRDRLLQENRELIDPQIKIKRERKAMEARNRVFKESLNLAKQGLDDGADPINS